MSSANDPLYPILEFDPATNALIEPQRLNEALDVPEHCVVCFFQDVIDHLRREYEVRVLAERPSEIGQHPLYELGLQRGRLAVFHPGIGAPLAVGLLEEVIARGCRKFIVCGSGTLLDREKTAGQLIVPTAAVRDEGTSYHYAPPGRELGPSPEAVAALEKTLQQHRVAYTLGKTWTTDAIYRETFDKIQRRRLEGCLAVEMEAAALFALAQFRGVTLGQVLYCGEEVSGLAGEDRASRTPAEARNNLFWLAAEACLSL
jgi:uridine phosphorylase